MRVVKASATIRPAFSASVIQEWLKNGWIKFVIVSPSFGYFKINEFVMAALGILRYARSENPDVIDPDFLEHFFAALTEIAAVIDLPFMVDSTPIEQLGPTIAYDSDGVVWYGFGVRLIPETDGIPSAPVLDMSGKGMSIKGLDEVFPSVVSTGSASPSDKDISIGYWQWTMPNLSPTTFPFDSAVPGAEGVFYPDVAFRILNVGENEIEVEYLESGDKEKLPLDKFSKLFVTWTKLP